MTFTSAATHNSSVTIAKPTESLWVATFALLITQNPADVKTKMLMFLLGAITATVIIFTLIWIALG
jgi:hypothetical protein